MLKPTLSQVGCAGRIISYRETEDNRYLITLAGICRFRVTEEMPALSPYRQVACDFAPFAGDLAQSEDGDFPRERLLAALKDYLSRRDMKADWKSVMTAPAGIAGQCAGHDVPVRAGGETGAAGSAELDRARHHPGGAAGDVHRPPGPGIAELSAAMDDRSQAAGNPGLPADQDHAALRPRTAGTGQPRRRPRLSHPRRRADHAGRRGARAERTRNAMHR